jgi:hypothetical protein
MAQRKSRRLADATERHLLTMPVQAAIDSVTVCHTVSPLTGLLSEVQLAQTVVALQISGYAILEGAVDPTNLDALHDKMAGDLHEDLLAEAEPPSNYVRGHLQHTPPCFHPHVFPDIVANPAVEQLCTAMLGDHAFLSFYSGNTNLVGSKQQPIHADIGHGSRMQREPRTLCVNIALVDTTEANGSIELWPGTHLDPKLRARDEHQQISPADFEARERHVPPVRGNTTKGSVLVRDPRLWHRGMENGSSAARVMLTLMYEAEGVQPIEPRSTAPRFHSSCQPAFRGSALSTNVVFYDDEAPE